MLLSTIKKLKIFLKKKNNSRLIRNCLKYCKTCQKKKSSKKLQKEVRKKSLKNYVNDDNNNIDDDDAVESCKQTLKMRN